jgi:hypothetical protein
VGALPVLAALETPGGANGACAFQEEDPAAAICLANGLMQAVGDARRRWLPSNISSHVEQVFADLAPDLHVQTVGTSFCNLCGVLGILLGNPEAVPAAISADQSIACAAFLQRVTTACSICIV